MTKTIAVENKNDFIDLLIGVSEQLINVISEENSLLKDRKYNTAGGLQNEKARLSFAYENQIRVLRENPAVVASISPDQRILLNDLAARFDEAASENLHLLAAARHVNLRVLEAIRDAAIEQVTSTRGYSNPTNAPIASKGNKEALSVTLDQRL